MMAKNPTHFSDPIAAAAAKKGAAVERKKLTVEIPVDVFRAVQIAKAHSGTEIRDLVAEALSAYPEIAAHLPKQGAANA